MTDEQFDLTQEIQNIISNGNNLIAQLIQYDRGEHSIYDIEMNPII